MASTKLVSFREEEEEESKKAAEMDSDTDIDSSSSDEDSSEDEETKDRKARKMAIWERPTEIFETLEVVGTLCNTNNTCWRNRRHIFTT